MYPDTLVAHRDLAPTVNALSGNSDRTLFRGVFNRIAQQVLNGLADAKRIALQLFADPKPDGQVHLVVYFHYGALDDSFKQVFD